jgi:hypothetical protein
VVISPAEEPLGEIRVRASAAQAEKLAEWAAAWPERTWAVEGAAGLGRLLARQLVAAGERVLDVQPKLASRVRLLQAGDTNKNDPDNALSVAVAALRSRTCRQVLAATLFAHEPAGFGVHVPAGLGGDVLGLGRPGGAGEQAGWRARPPGLALRGGGSGRAVAGVTGVC